jgi:O-methyltransferase involved in polyketide biosynthesis
MHPNEKHDRAVISTADDAILAKLSCVEKGYYQDVFIHAMAKGVKGVDKKRDGTSSVEPIIRKGTHARVCAINQTISAFLSLPFEDERRQVVILGAGRDTTYLKYRFGHLNGFEGKQVNWFEVDHAFVIEQKSHVWLRHCAPEGYNYYSEMNIATGHSFRVSFSRQNGSDAKDSNYHLIGHDLRDPPSSLFEKLSDPFNGYDTSIPTMFVMECVIMYLPDESSRNLLRYLSNNSIHPDSFVAVAIYDVIPDNDQFGQIMIINLQKRGIIGQKHKDEEQYEQLSLERTRTLSDHLAKLKTCGFDVAIGCNMMDAYDHGIISIGDRSRAARCEMLDELEEFVLMMRHYCLCVGAHSSGDRYKSSATVLCSAGKFSPIGFQDGRCLVVNR